MKLFELKRLHTESLDAAQSVIQSAESADRQLTTQEQSLFDAHMQEAQRIGAKLQAAESVNTLRAAVQRDGVGILLGGDPALAPSAGFAQPQANIVR